MRNTKKTSLFLGVIILLAAIAGLTVIGSMIWISMDAAKKPTIIPDDPGSSAVSVDTSEESSSGEQTSGKSDLPSEGDPEQSSAVSGETSGKTSERTSGKTSERTSGKTSERTSGKASEKTSEKTSEMNPTGDGDTYVPYRPEEKIIAVTFDDGPSYYTDIILDKIEGTDDHVTFFVVGNRISETANYEAQVKRAYEQGCEIGNHTYKHVYLTNLSDEDAAEQLRKTDEALKKVIGVGTSIMRPPGGYFSKSKNYHYANIMWDGDTEDWKKAGYARKGTMSKDDVIDLVYDEIIKQAKNYGSGTIVLLHDIYETSAKAFCRAYDTLKAEGWKFVTVSDLLKIQGREKDLKNYVFYSSRNVWLNGEKVTLG